MTSSTPHYDGIESFESDLATWFHSTFERHLSLFREQSELLLEGQLDSHSAYSSDESRNVLYLLIARLFNDFESARKLLENGFCDQTNMLIRDSIESMLLIELFVRDGELATRWMTDLKQYRAGMLIKTLKEKHGFDSPLAALYYVYSQLAHPNFLGSINTVTESPIDENYFLRQYHFGGMRNESMIRIQLNQLLMTQMMALHTLSSVYVEMHPNYSEWRAKVEALPGRLRDELGADVKIEYESDPESKEFRQVYEKLGFRAFAEKYGADFSNRDEV